MLVGARIGLSRVSIRNHSKCYKPEKHEVVRRLTTIVKDEVEVVIVGLTFRSVNDSQASG